MLISRANFKLTRVQPIVDKCNTVHPENWYTESINKKQKVYESIIYNSINKIYKNIVNVSIC